MVPELFLSIHSYRQGIPSILALSRSEGKILFDPLLNLPTQSGARSAGYRVQKTIAITEHSHQLHIKISRGHLEFWEVILARCRTIHRYLASLSSAISSLEANINTALAESSY